MATELLQDTRRLRSVLGKYATGVAIITTQAAEAGPVGITVNSFSSVSLAPPLVMWSIACKAYSRPVFEAAGYWAVHILAYEQDELSARFAQAGADKFADIPVERGLHGLPLLPGCAARLQCKSSLIHEGGDHLILLGEVLDYEANEAAPLVFHSGKYGAFQERTL